MSAGPAGPRIARPGLDEPPPFWGRWGRIYWLIAGLFAVETFAFWLLAKWAA